MVKFGRHYQFFLDNEHKSSNLYVVPYNFVKDTCIETKCKDSEDDCKLGEKFTSVFRDCLAKATADFNHATTSFWSIIFRHIGSTHPEESRGALPHAALRMYLLEATIEETQLLLASLRDLHSTALMNAEALRKLVRKFDKKHPGFQLSVVLLPDVYGSNFTMGQGMLENGLAMLRTHLGLDKDDAGEEEKKDFEDGDSAAERIRGLILDEMLDYPPPTVANEDSKDSGRGSPTSGFPPLGFSKKDSHAELLARRKSELSWLRSLVSSIAPDEMCHIVAHRGFHSPQDRSDRRPLENSLMAYEAAWTNGVHLCECDVALTKDERLILSHDEDFSRLALDPSSPLCNRNVTDLTLKELISCPLKSGSRPPLLIDVLRSAHAIGGNAKLVIEIKPGNAEAGSALARMFARHVDLMKHCEAVISFDAFALHNLRRELEVVLGRWDCASAGASRIGGGGVGGLSSVARSPSAVSIAQIPTSMSIGHFVAAESSASYGNLQSAAEAASLLSGCVHGNATGRDSSTMGRRIDSTDHFGVGMSVVGGLAATDSFNFSPFQRPTLLAQEGAEAAHQASPVTQAASDAELTAVAASPARPKILLLTVSDPPKKDCELFADVSDLGHVERWIAGGSDNGSNCLDGVYLQFQKAMLEPYGVNNLRKLSDRYAVGCWGHNGRDPDDWETFHRLVRDCGLSYVNSDLPRRFKKGALLGHRGVSMAT